MTTVLGPETPTPSCLISEINQMQLSVKKVTESSDELFNFGSEYYRKLCSIFRLNIGINIDDRICVISSPKNRLATELETRLNLIYSVFRLSPKRILLEDISNGNRTIKVGTVETGAEDYFCNNCGQEKFDKVVIADGLEMINDRDTFLEQIKNALSEDSESSIVILHKTRDIVTLPVYAEVLRSLEINQVEIYEILESLLRLNFTVGWGLVSLPITVPKKKWLNQLYNHYPPIMDLAHTTDVLGGLRELVETSFKYIDYDATMSDTFLLLVASQSTGFCLYKMATESNHYSQVALMEDGLEKDAFLLRMPITQDVKDLLPNKENMLRRGSDECRGPEEWWGTIPSLSLGVVDKSRINHYIH